MIEFRNVWKSFSGHEVLRGLNLTVARGEILFIIGASGVGKSVTIKHLIGLLKVDSRGGLPRRRAGRPALRRGAAPGAPPLRHGVSALDAVRLDDGDRNVALPLRKHHRLTPAEARRQALGFLGKVHMAEFAEHLPAALSDGMRKRVAIARALTLQPQCMLFDEPTTGLDPVSARRVDALIRELKRELRVTAIVVSHDLTSIFAVADRVALLYQGRVHALGTPEELRHSPDPVVQQFITGQAEGPMETPGF